MIKNNLVLVIGLLSLSFLYMLFDIASPLNIIVYAQKQENTADISDKPIEFLAIQTAKSGSLSQINETAYTLQLTNVSNNTILFSDRPERIVETVSTADFVGNWAFGPNSFSSDAPNDALIVENKETGQLETAIIESSNPVFNMSKNNTLTYTIIFENSSSLNLPDQFVQPVVVMDDEVIFDIEELDIGDVKRLDPNTAKSSMMRSTTDTLTSMTRSVK